MHGELPEHFNLASHFLDVQAALHPGRVAIVGEPREVTYSELAELANRAGNALRAQGVSRGDRVLIAQPDSAEFIAAFFGAAKIGALAVPWILLPSSPVTFITLEKTKPKPRFANAECPREFFPVSAWRPQ